MFELRHERLDSAHPLVREKGREFFRVAALDGHHLLVVRVWSSWAEQMGIYQVGRTLNVATGLWEETGPVRTKALPGKSAHNVMTLDKQPASMAFDIIPLDQNGRELWIALDKAGRPLETAEQNELRWLKTYGRRAHAVWNELYRLMAKCGLDAYGDTWGAYLAWDKGHAEEGGWKLVLEPLGLMLPTLEGAKEA